MMTVVRWFISLAGTAALVALALNTWVIASTRGAIYDTAERIPATDVAVVLGTSPYTHTGRPNLLFENRINAAAQLYHAGKARFLLVSGANPSKAYNEPQKMYQALRRLGVPDSAITLDFAGFRTLDSIVRARAVFGVSRTTLITQRYHEYRALFIARHTGLAARGYTWPDEDRRQPLRTEAREYFARVKAVLDLFVLGTPPRFLGPPRPIDTRAPAVLEYFSAGWLGERGTGVPPTRSVPLRGL